MLEHRPQIVAVRDAELAATLRDKAPDGTRVLHGAEGLIEENEARVNKNLRELADKHPAVTQAKVMHGKPSTAILEAAKSLGADCIVIVSHKPGIEDYFIGSTAARVVRHAACSVHVYRQGTLAH